MAIKLTDSILPIELIIQILALLSPESLLRCRCVCKQWRSLISDHHFIKSHLKSSSINKQTHRLVFISRTTLALRTCSVRALSNEPCVETTDIGNSLLGHRKWARIVGSCNGLLCVTSLTYTLSIWNPSTRSSRRLIGGNLGDPRTTVYGFGYDESNDDYKTVMIYNTGSVNTYSLKKNSCKRIHDFPGLPTGSSGKYVSGALHWTATGTNNSSSKVIISLDLRTERYDEVSQPEYEESGSRFEVGVLGGWLCVICEVSRAQIDIWVMKEYGKKESWTKFVSVPYLAEPMGSGSARYWDPLCILNNKEILFKIMNRLVIYSPKENALKQVDIRNYDATGEVYPYVESMVSPVC